MWSAVFPWGRGGGDMMYCWGDFMVMVMTTVKSGASMRSYQL